MGTESQDENGMRAGLGWEGRERLTPQEGETWGREGSERSSVLDQGMGYQGESGSKHASAEAHSGHL